MSVKNTVKEREKLIKHVSAIEDMLICSFDSIQKQNDDINLLKIYIEKMISKSVELYRDCLKSTIENQDKLIKRAYISGIFTGCIALPVIIIALNTIL